jgi:hypothetical protein
MHDIVMVCHVHFFNNNYRCLLLLPEGGGGNGGGDPKGKTTNTTPDPKKMSMLRYMQGKTAYAIARGEEPP